MVTLPAEAGDDPALVRDLFEGGMEIARINCAHDDRESWGRMVANVRAESDRRQRPCRILMDLAGPKLRTGAIRPGPAVTKVRPTRDDLGRVTQPARLRLSPGGTPAQAASSGDPTITVDAGWLMRRAVGDVVELTDARG
jgi:pyruvate kinase